MTALSCIASPVLPTDELPLRTALIWDLYRYVGSRYSDRTYARILEVVDNTCVLRDVSWGKLLRDSQDTADALWQGMPESDNVSVGILGSSNYEYVVHVVACWLNKWTPLPLSTRNSPETCHYLLQSVNAIALIADPNFHSDAQKLRDSGFEIAVIPFHRRDMDLTPATASVKVKEGLQRLTHSLEDIIVYTHTSGSQGHPKTIPITHRHFLATIRSRSASAFSGCSVYAPLPVFHGMGLYSLTRWPLGSGVVPILLDLRRPITIDVVSQHLRMLPDVVAFLPPSILEDALAHDTYTTALAGARRVFFAGAPLREAAGECLIRREVKLASAYGMSEVSLLSVLQPESPGSRDIWQYVRLRDDSYRLEFRAVDDSAARELIVCPGADDAPSVVNSTDPAGFATNDLWLPHPTQRGLWKYIGRKDSLTVLSTGEKTDDRELENLILRDGRIALVVVYGSGKPYNGVILQFSPAAEMLNVSLDDVWPTIEYANSVVPRHSRLLMNMVLIARADKHFVLSDKGTVRKTETLALYEEEIKASYERTDTVREMSTAAPYPRTFSQEHIHDYLRGLVVRIRGEAVSDDQDLFDAGLDSLHALQIRAAVMQILSAPTIASTEIPLNIAYSHPTIQALTNFIVNCLHGEDRKSPTAQSVDAIQPSIQRFCQGLTASKHILGQPSASSGHVVALTGSTGSLGCHLLQHLLKDPGVRLIYCLPRWNQGVDAASEQFHAMKQRGLGSDPLREALEQGRLQFCPIKLASPDLGLDESLAIRLRSEVTHIIHAAWHLNFNWPLERFEPVYVAGTRYLVDLALSSLRTPAPRFIFISSVGAVGGYNQRVAVPERAINDAGVASSQGYGRAKYVCERVLVEASNAGLQVAIVRPGQLSGGIEHGVWSLKEHIPMLINASLVLGKIPEDLPPLRWLPVDVAAEAIVELSLRSEQQQVSVHHIENSVATPWTEAVNMLKEAADLPLDIVPNSVWLEALQRGHSACAIPAVALLQFYSDWLVAEKSWVTLDVTETSLVCPMLRYGKVTPCLMQKYVRYIMRSMRNPR
ncbi:acetyl-CoA synthetase-like protein [Heliocybe sulcata]|uniref:Acetyl-CoA synthetase-like protein n=1 Tax=Heliocybe sulcata TaxID=5364 RepID=A0A5C3N214_9AGAM|nr:acetyl-CoA synthetase-like protein [Heliocybe sulcata]